MITTDTVTLSSADVLAIFADRGLTRRRLAYWVSTGIATAAVPPSGSGSRMRFDESDLWSIADLLDRIDACPLNH